MVDFGAAIKRPFEDIKTLIISFIIGIIPLAGVLLTGFAAHTAKNALEGKKALPTWGFSSIVDHLIKAILIVIIYIVYSLLGIIVLGFSVGTIVMGAIGSGGDTAALTSAILGAGVLALIGLLLLLIGGLLTPMAVMNYLQSNHLRDAFAVRKILKKTLTVKFLVSLIVVVAYGIVWSVVGGIITAVTLGFGAVLLPGMTLYLVQVTSYEVFAETFKETP